MRLQFQVPLNLEPLKSDIISRKLSWGQYIANLLAAIVKRPNRVFLLLRRRLIVWKDNGDNISEVSVSRRRAAGRITEFTFQRLSVGSRSLGTGLLPFCTLLIHVVREDARTFHYYHQLAFNLFNVQEGESDVS